MATADIRGTVGAADLVTVAGFDIVGNVGFEIVTPVVPDTTLPVVGNYSPSAGSQITATTRIEFDVTDDSGSFCAVMITASFQDGSWEVVHTGSQFSPRYAAGSARTTIANGYHYNLLRAGGWPYSPTIISYAIDAAGNQST